MASVVSWNSSLETWTTSRRAICASASRAAAGALAKLGPPRSGAVHARVDARPAKLPRETLGEGEDECLRRAVDGLERRRLEGGDARDVEEDALARRAELREERARHEDERLAVEPEEPREPLRLLPAEVTVRADAGAVHEPPGAAERARRLGEPGGRAVRGQVEHERVNGRGVPGLRLLGERPEAILAARHGEHRTAAPRELA